MTIEEMADKLWEDCKGAPKVNALPFIVLALQAAREEGIAFGKKGFELSITSGMFNRQDLRDAFDAGSRTAVEKAAEIIADYQWSHQNDARHRDALMDRIKSLKPQTQGASK